MINKINKLDKYIFYILIILGLVFSSNKNAIAYPDGKDGARNVTALGTVLNDYTYITSNINLGDTSISVNSGSLNVNNSTPLANGDLILIIQMQGASINTSDSVSYGNVTSYNSSGLYEFVYVKSVSGNIITLGCGTRNSYSVSGKTQVIRVPQYTDLTISGSSSVTAPAWNGQTGGIVAVKTTNSTAINGSINVAGLGFRGGVAVQTAVTFGSTGYVSTNSTVGNTKGESIAGNFSDYDTIGGRYGRGAPANGGGGGDNHNAGGGGGSNGNNGNTWTGQGIMCSSCTGNLAWTVDPGYIANGNSLTNSSGGGRGGYTFTSSVLPNPIDNTNVNNSPVPPGTGNNDMRREVGGLGGRPLNNSSERIFMGGGGGAGDGNNNASSSGGNGGGIVFILSNQVSGSGNINTDGLSAANTSGGNNDAPGGGGGGGSILIDSSTVSNISLLARGGAGGNQLITNAESEGPGGGGGGGYIASPLGYSSANVNGASNGTTSSSSLVSFPANGATSGATGQVTTSSVPICSPTTNINITKTASVSDITVGSPITYTIGITNTGELNAQNVAILDTVPAEITGVTWSCTILGGASCSSISGTGNTISLTANVPQGTGNSITIIINGTLSSNPPTNPLANTVIATVPTGLTDIDLTNNIATANVNIDNNKLFTFSPDNSGNGNPGDTIYYNHEIFSRISGDVNLTFITQQGWTYTFFRDVNNNNLLDVGDTPIVNGALGNIYNDDTINHKAKLIVKAFIPANTPQNTVDGLKLTATLTPTNTLIPTSLLTVEDITTVSKVSSLLKLVKTVDKNKASPGEIITYTITYSNSGSSSLNNIELEDVVPANTSFVSAVHIGACSTDGNYNSVTKKINWVIIGDLGAGQSGCVNFSVMVN